MATMNIKKGDTVMIITGEEAGKKGKVLKVLPEENKIVVEGRNKVTKHQKPRNQKDTGGIVEREAAINASNVMVVCPKCGKPVRTGIKLVDTKDKKVRICKKCGAEIKTDDDTK